MPSRIVLGGRLFYGSRGSDAKPLASRVPKELVAAAQPWKAGEDPTDAPPDDLGSLPVHPHPFSPVSSPHAPPKKAGVPIQDEDGIWYRVCDRLDPKEGWCLAEQLMVHYAVPFSVLRDWALKGFVEPAVELGSPTKRFRVRDDNHLRTLARAWKKANGLGPAPKVSKAAREKYAALLPPQSLKSPKKRSARFGAAVEAAIESNVSKRSFLPRTR